MKNFGHRKYLVALVALVLVFAGCKGESPTAPPLGSPPGDSGTGTPPVGATITLAVANPTPQAGSNTLISATVRQGNNNVPDGTAVEFSTTFGVFQENGANIVIRTTTGGVATATLGATAVGTATVRAVVNNVSQTTTVNFIPRDTDPGPPPPTSPSISGITPIIGPPTGGFLITIRGTNFRPPVKVFFDFGNGQLREATVTSFSPTQIQVLAPVVDLGAGQTAPADIIVFFEQGTPSETSITFGTPFTFQNAILEPIIRSISPASGPIDGGTRVTIVGEGFEHPAQLFFGAAEAQTINVTFSQIIAVAPPARDTSDNGSGAVTGSVDVRVVNMRSGATGSLSAGFRYTPKMQITAAGPTEGPFTGGTRVRIDGTGFDEPVAVSIAGVGAQPVFVSGSQVIAVTSPVAIDGCADVSDIIQVVNVDNGDSADGPEFTYRVLKPVITSVSQNTPVGGTITITVLNAIGIDRLRLGDTTLQIASATENPDGSTTFTAVVPGTIDLDTEACAGVTGVNAEQPTAFDVEYESLTTGCIDTLTEGAVIIPPNVAILTFTPGAFTPFTATITPAQAGPPPVPPSVAPSPAQTVTIVNRGTAPLTVNSVTTDPATPGCSQFSVVPPSTPVILQQCDTAPIIAQFNGSTTPSTVSCNVIVNTSAGTRTLTLIGTSQ
jgi:hypothetical protein